ncbi:MAG: right-handed parallel beta-helix repeat-containing protein, partial [Thermoplasmata archaeon]
MKKGAGSIGLVCLLVTAGFLGFITFESEVVISATTYYVGSGPGNDSASIQDAIDYNATDGDTVFVWRGTYNESIIVNKTITLQGEDRNITIINGTGTADTVFIDRNLVNVTGFTITNGTKGIFINTSINNVTIENNNATMNNNHGIKLNSAHNITIKNNILFNNSDAGIYVFSS